MSLNINYGENASFFCSARGDSRGGQVYWIIGGIYNNPIATLDQDGYKTVYMVFPPIRNSTLYVNGSLYANNNLEIQCGVFDILSNTAVLKIRGIQIL